MLQNLAVNKRTGLDINPAKVLKLCSNFLAYPVSYLVNLSFTKANFPDCLKHAKACPIHKAGSKRKIESYQPIYVLPALSKIFDRAMLNHLYKFLKKENVLYKKHFGFQPKRSTTDVLIKITESILFAHKNLPAAFYLTLRKPLTLLIILNCFKRFLNMVSEELHWNGLNLIRRTKPIALS